MDRRVGWFVLGSVLVLAAIVGTLRSETEKAESLQELAAARVKVARRALDKVEIRRTASPDFLVDDGLDIKGIIAWSRRLMEAEIDASKTQAEHIAAIQGHVDRLKNWYAIVEIQHKSNAGSGDNLDLVEYYLLEGKELLVKAQAEGAKEGS